MHKFITILVYIILAVAYLLIGGAVSGWLEYTMTKGARGDRYKSWSNPIRTADKGDLWMLATVSTIWPIIFTLLSLIHLGPIIATIPHWTATKVIHWCWLKRDSEL